MTIDIKSWGDQFESDKIKDRGYKMNPPSYIFYVGDGGPTITVTDDAFEYKDDKTELERILNEWIDNKSAGDHVLKKDTLSGSAE